MTPETGAKPEETLQMLVFIARNGRVAALSRETGRLVWLSSSLHKRGWFRSWLSMLLWLDRDRLFVSTGGRILCLDPLTGALLWSNPSSEMGWSTTYPMAMVSMAGIDAQMSAQQKAVFDAHAAAAAADAAATSS